MSPENATHLQGTPIKSFLHDLPEYERPPISEVAISVQFEQLENFKPAHFGLYWELIRERYPKTEYHPPIPSIIEFVGGQGLQPATLSVEAEFPVGRSWFLSSDQLRLIQVQPDRFIVNWRKLETESEYPRYENLKSIFNDELAIFLGFISKHELGMFEPTHCELTYVNHIFAGEGWTKHGDLSNVLTVWSGQSTEAYLPEISEAQLHWQYRFEEDGEAIGRMKVQVQSGLRRRDSLPVFVLQLTARGDPLDSGLNGVLSFTDRAHEWIVRGFTDLTTARMHREWGRKR